MKKLSLIAIVLLSLGACAVPVNAAPVNKPTAEHTMTMAQMNYFLDRIHYGSK